MASELIRYFGEPFADSSAIPTWLVSQIAREQVTVALSGDGGDELFAGYSWLHMAERVAAYRRAPETLRRLAGVGLALVPRGPVWDKVRRFQSDSFLSPMEAYRRRETCLGAAQRARLYTPEVSARLTRCAWDRFAEHWEAGAHLDERDRMLHQDLRMYLPDDILTKVDRMSMAVSLEARVPLLDHRIVELAGSIPFSLKYAAGESKRTPKAAFREMLPESLLAQRKRGFALPIQAWFRGELADLFRETVLREGSRCRMLFEESEVSRMFEAHIAVREDYGHALWALLQVEFWLRYADRHPELRVRL